ncbi:MAG: hypothetical protein K9W45_13130 [Candidatus Heimdallarchaeum aukensis]|uniref:Yip1 domain-containing protein n=1 Tax=Candidatus Heimdallarchaeum aukensis TaxID=2876573 RepID=A0A9Y1FKY6_9ARCH|nr:MAG: hypothetical protein K9W45_13130 [Candidatus Heimdallarchaeum aukensis]
MSSTIVNLYLGGLTFNKIKVDETVSNKSVTLLSWFALFIYMLLEAIFSVIAGKPAGHSAFARYTNLSGFWLFFAVIVSSLIATVVFAAILLGLFKLFELTCVLIRRLFKTEKESKEEVKKISLTFNGFIRVVAVGVVWKYISAIGVLFSGTPKTIITGLGYFISLFCIGFASKRYSKKSVFVVIIIMILAFFISFALGVVWSDILEKLLGLTK